VEDVTLFIEARVRYAFEKKVISYCVEVAVNSGAFDGRLPG
jgi:hypothetical protein